MTAADKYYLKAKDNYPYNLDEALEALEYGLSCDDTHAGLLTLQGEIYYKDLRNFELARDYFETALFYDSGFIDAYYAYIKLCIATNDHSKAELLIERALKVKGIDLSQITYRSATMYEKRGMYADAVSNIKQAMIHCSEKGCYNFLEEELERLQQKTKNAYEAKAKLNIILK